MRTIDIKKNDANQRLDKFLSKRFKTMPKSLMYKYIRTKYIKLNGKKCDIKDMLTAFQWHSSLIPFRLPAQPDS